MDLIKKVNQYTIDDKDYILCFDVASIPVYKKMTGKSFLKSVVGITNLNDEDILGFLAASLRHKETPDIPIEDEIFEFNIIGLLLTLYDDVIDIVTSSMPQSSDGEKTKKKQTLKI